MVAPKENRNDSHDSTTSPPRSKSSQTSYRGWFWILIAAAGLFRFFSLGLKPPHFDEGINGHFVLSIWRDGFYTYDPTNFHGPLYFYLCHLAEVILGRGVESFRFMNALVAMALVAMIFQFRRFVGGSAVLAAGVIAVSPAFTFYGRYAIHETLFIFGQVLFVYGRFEWFSRPSRRALVLMSLALVILLTTKETFFIFLGTWLIAEVFVAGMERLEWGRFKSGFSWTSFSALPSFEKRKLYFNGLTIAVVAVFSILVLFNGFFENPKGWVDFFRAFNFWSSTGTVGNGHEKPFFYWIEILFRYEWALLLGLVFSLFTTIVMGRDLRKERLLLLFGFGHWLAYSLIPYKTPWLVLNFWSLAFFASALPMVLKNASRVSKVLAGVAVFLILCSAAFKSWQLNFVNPTDSSEPYVYVQTTDDYTKAMTVLREKVKRSPEARNMSIIILIRDPWPLPYDLSQFPKIRYARMEDLERDASIVAGADVMLMDGSNLEELRKTFPKRFARMRFQLRDAYGSGWVLFDEDKFRSVLPGDLDFEEAVK